MKNTLFYILLLCSGMASAQAIVVPDANFSAKLFEANATNDIAKNSSGDAIAIDADGDGIITEEEAEEVRELNIASSDIYSLTGIEHFVDLRILDCSDNMITSFNATPLTDLRELRCSDNQITNIQVLGLDNLKILDCGTNSISVLDVTGLEYLEGLYCNNNNLTTLDLNSNTNLAYLRCNENELVTLFVKNGKNETFDPANWGENSSLVYICADESQIASMMLVMPATIQVNPYCSYEPGGIYNSITGVMKFDLDANGCNAADFLMPSVKLKISDGAYEDTVFTETDGTYIFYAGSGTYTVTPQFENNFFTASPVAATADFPLDGPIVTQDFCITPNGIYPDVEVIMAPASDAQPGFDAEYKIVYKNKGSQTIAAGSVTCNWDSTRLGYVFMEPFADVIEPDTYTWNFTDLLPFESREISMILNLNSPTDVPPVNIDDVLPFTMSIVPGGDEVPEDNTFEFNQVAVGAMNPNNIICIEGESVSPETVGDYLHYIVNFENTGTAPATFVVIEQDINPDEFDISTLQLINSSHDTKSRIVADKITFRLDNANLGVADHGNILFKIKSKNSLMQGDMVKNKANIYFDYNFPIQTNEASTLFETLSTGEFTLDKSVRVYPNPSGGNITISSDNNLQSIQLYDIQGRLLQIAIENDTTTTLDITDRASGIYFLKITTDKGVKVEKLIRE